MRDYTSHNHEWKKSGTQNIFKKHHKGLATYWHHLFKSIQNGDKPLQKAEQALTRAFCISETV